MKQNENYNKNNEIKKDISKCVSEKDFDVFMNIFNSNAIGK